jgi:hypothetical protein
MLSICDINKMFGGEGKQNPRDSKLTAMLIIYLTLNQFSTLIFVKLYDKVCFKL